MRRATLTPALLLLVAALSARADPADDDFARCMAARAKARGVAGYAIGRLKDDGHGVQRVAVLSDELVLEQEPGHRWTFDTELPRTEFSTCGVPEDGVWREWPCTAASFGDPESAYTASVEVALRDGKPAILRESEFVSQGGHSMGRSSTDYDLLVAESEEPEDEPAEDEEGNVIDAPVRTQKSVQRTLVALAAGSKWADSVPLHPSAPTWGQERWTGPADARLEARARRDADGSVHLLLATFDDVRVPLAADTAKAMVAADHLEIWFYDPQTAGGGAPAAYQLGVAAGKSGKLTARWLTTGKEPRPLPTMSGTLNALDVTVPAWALPGDAAGTRRAMLGVEYSDSDDPKKGQQTMVGLVEGRPPKVRGLQLIAYPDGARWPRPARLREVSCDAKP